MANKFVVDADAFRFYEDDGATSESDSTAIAAQDTNVTRNIYGDNRVHLRYRVQEVGAGSIGGGASDDYTIQYQVNGGGGWTTIQLLTVRVQMDTGSELSNGDPTTDRGTDGISAGSGSFFAGEQEDQGGEITNFVHQADNYTEHVWALFLPNADWTDGDFVDFRMRLNGGSMDNSIVPRLTNVEVAAGGPGLHAIQMRRRRTVNGLLTRARRAA